MSRFFSGRHGKLVPYVPGEQPRERAYVKLNTNESPFPPSPLAVKYAAEAAKHIELYSDPECGRLVSVAAARFGIGRDEILFTNGSDEILNFAFMAFCDSSRPAAFPDVTYGFYAVFAELNGVPCEEIPLRGDFSVCLDDYVGRRGAIFLANPNAPTGLALPVCEIERVVRLNPDCAVVIDEAYIDFGGESAVPLVHQYDNLLVTQTFSKSRSMAGARLGFGIAQRELIRDLRAMKYSTNPYNVNAMTMAAGIGALEDDQYTRKACAEVRAVRDRSAAELAKLGFSMPPSSANFLFARHERLSGGEIYQELREKGVLVRHFEGSRVRDYNRITVGSREQMDALIAALREILEV